MCPGPQSVTMIKYLESLTKTIDVSHMNQPCSNSVPIGIYSDNGEPEAKSPCSTADNGGPLWKYFVKK